jgi:predicted metal-binding protein
MMTEIACEDQCWDCIDVKRTCDAIFERDLSVSKVVTCNKCKHEYTYTEEGQ